MKTLIIAIVAAMLTGEILADYPDVVKNDPRNTPEAIAARKLRRMTKTGGIIDDYRDYKGQFLYLNSQALVKVEEIEKLTVGTMNEFFRAKFAIMPSEKFEISKAVELMKKADAQAAVFLIDDLTLPTVLSSPEEKWSLVNVGKLAADKPDQATLSRRVRREMWRALAFTLGYAAPDELCVLKPVHSLKDLDDLSANALSRFPVMAIKEALPKVGIGSIHSCTYKKACEEGWAPAPTNEFQKGVWDLVHELPSKPIKVEFDPKNGK